MKRETRFLRSHHQWIPLCLGFLFGSLLYLALNTATGQVTWSHHQHQDGAASGEEYARLLPGTNTIIPTVINRVYHDVVVPTQFRYWLNSWEKFNPSWTQILWTDGACVAFLREKHPKLLPAYETASERAEKSNIVTYALMYSYGGVYVHMDVEATQPLGTLLEHKSCILTNESLEHQHLFYDGIKPQKLLSSAFMACKPRHPFFKLLLTLIPASILDGRKRLADISVSSGHLFLSSSYEFYNKELKKEKSDIDIAPSSYFSPKVDIEKYHYMEKRCQDDQERLTALQVKACAQLATAGIHAYHARTTYGIHHYYHGTGTETWTPGPPVNITDVIPDIRIV